MARSNDEVAALLQEYADLIPLTGGDAFRARVHEKAARALAAHPADVSTLDVQRLKEIPNVGRSIAEKVVEYFSTGRVAALEELRARVPAGVRQLTAIPTLGPKKALVLHRELGICTVDELAGHPTTRLIGRRPGIDADLDAVFAACARTGTALEINSHPDRLDLRDEDILRARRHGARFAVDSDAHAMTHLGNLRFGVGTAQRGWLTADDVVNAWPLERLRRFLDKRAGTADRGRPRPTGAR
nr:helix-hairpin-helix domain-containing protein [Streptomyces viridochromogenes]